MVLTHAQRAEKAKVAAMQLNMASEQLKSLENLVAIEINKGSSTKQMCEMLSNRINQLELFAKTWIDVAFHVISDKDTDNMLQETQALNERIQQFHVSLCIIAGNVPEPQLNTSQSPQRCQMKLPKLPMIQIPEFTGKDGEWERFKELFVSVIDSREDLDDLKKLNYLKGYCTEGAALTIAGITITAANYKVAWERLKKKYEDHPLVISRLISSLINLHPMTVLTADEMQKMMAQVSAIVINLNALDQQLNSCANVLLVEIVVQKLHSYLRELWEIEKNKLNTSTWEELETFLEKHRRIKQQLEEHNQQGTSNEVKPTRQNRTLFSQTCRSCPMCKNHHEIIQCEQFRDLMADQRVQVIGQLRLCYKCLQTSGHSARHCPSQIGCACTGNHHELLHGARFGQPVTQNTLTSRNEATTTPRGASDALLTTALVTVLDKESKMHNCRAIIDTASHSSYITKSLATKLGLKEQTGEFVATGLNGTVTATTSKLVTSVVGSRISNYVEMVEFNVIPHITDPLPLGELAIDDWEIPRECSLADPSFYTSTPVDMLLSANVFFNALKSGLIRTPRATLLNSEFGWLVGGNQPKRSVANLMTRPSAYKSSNNKPRVERKLKEPRCNHESANPRLVGEFVHNPLVSPSRMYNLPEMHSETDQQPTMKRSRDRWYHNRVKRRGNRPMRLQFAPYQQMSDSLVRVIKTGVSDRAITRTQPTYRKMYSDQHFYDY